jgi:CheY-like chemotaxis protein
VFAVADTGIGIAPDDRERIFEEFTQVDNPLQRRARGTGLGLPLVRKLAGLLGGDVSVDSTLGVGSTFTATIPVTYARATPEAPITDDAAPVEATRPTVLLVEDSPQDVLLYEHYFRHSPFGVAVAPTVAEARRQLERIRPVAIILDIRLAGNDSWAFIAEVRQSVATRALPLIVVTGIDDHSKGLALGADAYARKPIHRAWLLDTLARLIAARRPPRLLVIDDEASRYLVRARLVGTPLTVHEAAGGMEGLREARAQRPHAIVLDLIMPEMTGFEVMARLKEDPATTDIPVIVLTSKTLSDDERRLLAPHALRIISKDTLARTDRTDDLREALAAAGLPLERAHG